ncbi:MAG: hypothetical protein WC758_05120 [Candidatus Woesearchaeota archaeon]|jgi:hypothetical protein
MKKPTIILLLVFICIVITGCSSETICGDNKCSADENTGNCCLDCGCPQGFDCKQSACTQKEVCGNNFCGIGEDKSNCCGDCGCDYGFNCQNSVCKSNCGDGIKASDETQDNCCVDVGCSSGKTCENNICVILKPELKTTFEQTTKMDSVTFLKSVGSDVGIITLTNKGNDDAKNVKITISSPSRYFASQTVNIGEIYKGKTVTKNFDLNFVDLVLDVTTDEKMPIIVTISFENSVNQEYSSEESFNMDIKGRNYMNWRTPEMTAIWVTSTQPTIREFATKATAGLPAGMDGSDKVIQMMAARWLFESMRAYGVKYVNDAHATGDYVQFPIETLKNKAGDCDDNAILYSALLESIGMKSFLVLVPGHIFSGYVDSSGKLIPIETTANNFDDAILIGQSEYEQYVKSEDMLVMYPSEDWKEYPSVNLPEKFALNMPSITKEIQKCNVGFTLSQGWIAKMTVTFTNSGNAPSAGCAAMDVYDNKGSKISSDISCWVLNPGETKQEDYTSDIDLNNVLEGYVCIGH